MNNGIKFQKMRKNEEFCFFSETEIDIKKLDEWDELNTIQTTPYYWKKHFYREI